MMVITNAHRQTAIVLTQGPVWVTCVRMQDGQLHISRLSQGEMRRWRRLDYPTDKAVAKYLQHPGGVSDAARRELEALVFFGE